MSNNIDQAYMNKLRLDFKNRHFDPDADLGPLFKTYHATYLFYTNTTNKGKKALRLPNEKINDKLGLAPESLEFYNIYEREILKPVQADKPYMALSEVRICPDLIQMEYMQNSEEFNQAFCDMDAFWKKKVKEQQYNIHKGTVPKYLANNQLGQGEACFVLYLHPEFVDTVTCMMKDFKLPPAVQGALDKAREAQQFLINAQLQEMSVRAG